MGDSSSVGSPSGYGRGAEADIDSEDENLTVLRRTASVALHRLCELAAEDPDGKGKNPERGDDAWDSMTRLADLFKGSPQLYLSFNIKELIRATLPFLSDASTIRRRTAAYRLLRYSLDRKTWGTMINLGIEWVIVR